MTQVTPKRTVRLYTDGACSGNPGPGGWGCVLCYKDKVKELSGHMANTTNNRMEIFAVIAGLGALKEPCVVEVYSDSAYTVNAFNDHWIDNWQKNGWVNSKKQPVENSDLWKLLLQVIRTKNRCDELATSAIREYRRLNGEKTEEQPAKVGEEQAGKS